MDETAARDLYGVLGVARDVPAREIRRAYRRLARQHHPDLNRHPTGAEQFATLAHAYEILGDPTRRARYDRTLPKPAIGSRPQRIISGGRPPAAATVCHGILELTPAETLHAGRYPLALHDAHGHMIVLPAGTSDGDRITVADGSSIAVLTVRTQRKTCPPLRSISNGEDVLRFVSSTQRRFTWH